MTAQVAAGGGAAGDAGQARGATQLWYFDQDGALRVTRVRTGLSNGTVTQIEGDDVREGMRVIAAVTTGSGSGSSSRTSTTSGSPFTSPQQQGGPPRPPGGM
jgi:hypothetical protein